MSIFGHDKQRKELCIIDNHYTDDNKVVYNKYVFNGLWNFDDTITIKCETTTTIYSSKS